MTAAPSFRRTALLLVALAVELAAALWWTAR